MVEIFAYDCDPRLAPFWAPFGLRPWHDGVEVGEEGFDARFGFVRLRTSVANISGAHVTRDYRWWTAAGVRLSGADDGLTFGTNAREGVCIHFHAKVPTIMRRSGHSALTVTVTDVDGLVRRLSSSDG
ncbi:MAG: hypothetical protein ABIP21_02975 [Acidimicrobiia bacterium]